MNTVLLIAAVVLGLIFLALYAWSSLKSVSSGAGIGNWAERSFKRDLKDLASTLLDLLKGLVVMLGWLMYLIYGVFKSFVDWLRSKKDNKQQQVKNVKSTDLWCPRCKSYFGKEHKCFRGIR